MKFTIARRKRLAKFPAVFHPALLAELVDEGLLQAVFPRLSHFLQPTLDLLVWEIFQIVRRRLYDQVQSRMRIMGQVSGVRRDRPAIGRAEHLLNAQTQRSVHSVARNVDEARDEATERVSAREQCYPLSMLKIQDAACNLEQG